MLIVKTKYFSEVRRSKRDSIFSNMYTLASPMAISHTTMLAVGKQYHQP
jgi:hypothetical protein